MRRLPRVILLLLIIIFSFPAPAKAMEKFGPHLSTNYDPGLLDSLRSKYNTAGTSDWVPLTVLIPVQISSESLSGFLDSAAKNKFWPIIRVWNEGRKILNAEVDQFTSALTVVNNKNSLFPQSLVLVFGNEVNNLEDEWGGVVSDENVYLNTPQEYTNALAYFISQVKAKASSFKVANAPMNGSLPVFDLKTFDAIDFWNKGPKSEIDSLDYLAFNSYELGGADQRLTINGWSWEWQQIGSPGKPIILTEFGFNPNAAIDAREKFVGDEYQAYKNGQRGNLDNIFAITPLLWSNGPIKIPVFSSSGNVDWYDPADLGTGGGGGSTNATPTPQSYFSSPKGKKLNDTLADINKSFLPYGVQIKKDDTKINSQGVSASDTTSGQNEDTAILNPAVQYSVGTSVQTPEKSSTGIVFFLKNLWEGFLGLFGYGNQKATQFSSIQTPHDVARKELARSSETQSTNLALNNSDKNILGFMYSDKAMENSLALRQSENLPLSVGEGVKDQYGGGDNTLPNPPTGGGGGCGSGNCPLGVGYCSPDYLNTNYFHDDLKARKASIICQKESGSQPDSINRGCLKTDPAERTQEYSVGLYQINLWFDSRCDGTLIDKQLKTDTQPYSCKEGPNFTSCTDEFKDPDRNISFAVNLSGQGTNWTDWSAAAACNIPGGDEPLPICQSPIGDNCPDDSQAIRIPNSDFQLLDYRGGCIKPTMIVIHWSAAWTDVYATFNTLNQRELACQLATDQNITLQTQNFYKDQAQRGACVGTENGKAYNDFALNNEITGSYFDEVFDSPNNPNFPALQKSTKKALATTCFMMKQYNIPVTQIFGHFQLNDGNSDPGEQYLNDFIGQIQEKINNGTCL